MSTARSARRVRAFKWEKPVDGNAMLAYEPVGVCVLITPWNLPMNQIAAKVGLNRAGFAGGSNS